MRAIATKAGVDSALIHHYFGDKGGLFAAALQSPTAVSRRLIEAVGGEQDQLGGRIARAYLSLWEEDETRWQMLALARSSLTNESATENLRAAMAAAAGAAIAVLPPDNPQLRWSMGMSHLLGAALGRHLFQVPPLRDIAFDELVRVAAPAVQLHFTGELDLARQVQ